jgi:hypothetical protein
MSIDYSSGCVRCPEGCATTDTDATCPKYWQRVEGSALCSQAWICSSSTSSGIRLIGVVYLLVVLVYARLFYYNYKKHSAVSEGGAVGAPFAAGGFFQRVLNCFKGIPPQSYSRSYHVT